MNDQELNAAIDALTFPKVTKESIEARIAKVDYLTLPESTVTICSITMVNGFSVRGESACVDKRNFNQEIGNELAYKDAFGKLWAFEGYLLADTVHRHHGILSKTDIESWQRSEIEDIAELCHEVNRAYCTAIGDNSQPAWIDAPAWQKDSAMNGVQAHIKSDLTPEQSHASWMEQKRAEGWKYGPVKDADKKEHPCFVPYEELPLMQRVKDFLFRAVVKTYIGA